MKYFDGYEPSKNVTTETALDTVPPGFMVDTPWLKALGIDSKSIHDYVARGWLERVVRGVYRRPLPEGAQGDREESWAIPLLSLQWLMKYAVHLGGESALDRGMLLRVRVERSSSVALNRVCIPGGTETELAVVTTPTRLQAFAFELLDVNPGQFVPIRMAG
ncbi:MAG: AbiEi antitoxin N-terminal domain-containing protein [Rhodobacteraceae bacterium]|nr:AbiEi antitoxin N-terminal domain-containing protein [Paracoccaceae bacterium]